MRVSVVATGIDATVQAGDTPMPRRSMAAPLRPAAQAEPAPAPAPQPVAEPEVAARAPQVEEQEPNLFAGMEEEGDDGLPAPAYRPEVPAFEPRADARADGNPGFAEAATNLHEARAAERTGRGEAIGLGPVELGSRPAPQPQNEAEEKRGFGLNSLINRMTGHASDQPAKVTRPAAAGPTPAAPAPRPRPSATQYEAVTEENEDRIEIPAFLRRQAN